MKISEFNKGAAYARDNILCKIIGMQNKIGCNETNPQYQILQDLFNNIIDAYGDMTKPYKD